MYSSLTLADDGHVLAVSAVVSGVDWQLGAREDVGL